MTFKQWGCTLAATCSLGTAVAAVITTPAGVFTNPGGTNAGDTVVANTWLRVNVRNGGAVGINSAYPRNGSGSVYLSLGANTGNNGKADWEYYPSASFGRLADLGTYSYDWYRDATSTVAAHFHPAIRLYVDADGNPATTNDRGYLVFERCYNVASCPAVPTNVWTTESIGNTTNLWWSQPGVGIDETYNRTLATYKAGSYTPTAGFAQITGNSLILGVSVGIGSGWSTASTPAFQGAVDNVTLTSATSGAAQVSGDNFELATLVLADPVMVPALNVSLLAALAALMATVIGWQSRRRSRAKA